MWLLLGLQWSLWLEGLLPDAWTCVVPTRSLGWLQLGHWVGPWNVRICPIPWLKGIRTKSQSCIRVHSWDQGLKDCLQGHGWACHLLGSWSGRATPGPGLSGARATCCFRLCNQTEFGWPAFRGIETLSADGSLGRWDSSLTVAVRG